MQDALHEPVQLLNKFFGYSYSRVITLNVYQPLRAADLQARLGYM